MTELYRTKQLIYNDPEWREWSKIIGDFTTDDCPEFGMRRGIDRWFELSDVASNFAAAVDEKDKHSIFLADIAGYLSGCGLICGFRNYAKNGAMIARAYLKRFVKPFGLSDQDVEIICHAIAHQDTGGDIRNIVDAALCFADKICIDKSCIKDPCTAAQNAMVHIEKVTYEFKEINHEDTLAIYVKADEEFRPHEFTEIWPEVQMVPYKVATFLKKGIAFFLENGYLIWESSISPKGPQKEEF